jgi:hypothetical protein
MSNLNWIVDYDPNSAKSSPVILWSGEAEQPSKLYRLNETNEFKVHVIIKRFLLLIAKCITVLTFQIILKEIWLFRIGVFESITLHSFFPDDNCEDFNSNCNAMTIRMKT